jgi:hypothetical protein
MIGPPITRDNLRGLRAARWTRESTAGQTDKSGPEAQRFAQDEAIESLGLVDTGLSWQGAHSGFDEAALAASPQWADMLARAGAEYDLLVVAYASRFCRNGKAGRIAMDDLHRKGAVVYFAEDELLIQPGKANPDTDRWFAIMLEDEMYSRKLVRSMERTYRAKFRTHRDPGGMAPLGFRRTGGEPSVLEVDRATIERAVVVFRRYALGNISAERLGPEVGLHPEAIKPMLRNRIYNGWVQRYGHWEPAAWRAEPPVSDELWEQVTAVRESRNRGHGPRRKDHPDLLDGLLYCACGTRLWSDGVDGSGARRKRHRAPCPAWGRKERIRATMWEQPVEAQLTGIDLSPATIAQVVAALDQPPALPNEIGAKQIERDRRALADRYAKGVLTESEFLAEAGVLHEREQAMRTVSAPSGLTAEVAIGYLRDLGATWEAAAPQERANVAHAVYEKIEVVRDGFLAVTLTPDALRHGLALALPESVARVGGEGLEPPTFSV